jgi:hypothetical protein
MAEALGFCDVTIAAVGMDHCEAARNVAEAACAESVVDYFIHVDQESGQAQPGRLNQHC